MDPMKLQQQPTKYPLAVQFLRQKAQELAFHTTIKEVCAAAGCSHRVAERARKALQTAGEWPVPKNRRGPKPKSERNQVPAAAVKPVSPEEIMRRVLAGEVEPVTKEQRKQILSEYIRTSPAYVSKGMIETLTKLESSDGEDEAFVPPVPMTAGEAAERISRFLQAYGKPVAAMAWRKAFGRKNATNEAVQQISGSVEGPKDDGRVQGGDAPLGQQEGSEGDIPSPGDSYRPVGAA